VYAGAIAAVEGEPADGDAVDLYSAEGRFIARGLYNSQSKIRVRLYTWEEETRLDADFFRSKLADAIGLRRTLGLLEPGQACRLVCSEGDGLSGCMVDRYDRWLAVQFTSLGLAQRKQLLVDLLVEMLQPAGVYQRTERGIGQLEGLSLQDELLWGQPPVGPIEIQEGPVTFLVDLTQGQKTGFYLDQRDNRMVAAQLATGRRLLDVFCYSGGFGLHAARAGAAEVIGVDQSKPALELAQANAGRNQLSNISFVHEEVFSCLDRLDGASERFGMVILDPPKFARKQNAVEEALRGYRRLQSLALNLLERGGFLVTCCCSGLITMDMLEELIAQLAEKHRREVQLLSRRGPALDHPVSASCRESHYLKCLTMRVL
jgi:23S rRNA (cytosine1962-C5)-methyltransferase